MILDLIKIQQRYENSRGNREIGKYLFSFATLGLGALYFWATSTIIKEGEIGLRRTATGKMVLLPPGRHSNFPWERYLGRPQSLSEKTIKMGPYQILEAVWLNISNCSQSNFYHRNSDKVFSTFR